MKKLVQITEIDTSRYIQTVARTFPIQFNLEALQIRKWLKVSISQKLRIAQNIQFMRNMSVRSIPIYPTNQYRRHFFKVLNYIYIFSFSLLTETSVSWCGGFDDVHFRCLLGSLFPQAFWLRLTECRWKWPFIILFPNMSFLEQGF